jgi:hypothetical protein
MASYHLKVASALLVVAALSGCGGGGGGGSAGNSGAVQTTPTVPVTSGLVPDAPAAGAILYADAAPLRVLRDGAVWTYRGVKLPNGDGAYATQRIVYTNVVKHATAGVGVSESGSNSFNTGAESSGVRFEGGAYKSSTGLATSEKAAPLAIDMIELRSPVRINDQYVSFDKHIADSGGDYDGDKVNDAIDMAVYSRVIGEETLDLPNRRQVKTVRVDMTFRARVTSSANHSYSAVYESVRSTWYAPGIGIVKARLEEPNTAANAPNSVVTEVLENWDGLTEGLGHTGLAAAVVLPGVPLAGTSLPFPIDAVGFDTHAVVATSILNQPDYAGIALTQLDARGKVVAMRNYTRAELFPGVQYFREPRLLRVGDELRVLVVTDNSSVSMAAFDSTGQRLLRPSVTLFSDPQLIVVSDGVTYRTVADGAGLWVGWGHLTQDAYSQGRALMVQHFDANAQPVGAQRAVFSALWPSLSDFNMALDGTRLAVSWREQGVSTARHLALIDTGSGALLADKSLDSLLPCTRVDTLALAPGLAMTCWGNAQALRAARLDANGDPVLSAGTTLATDTIKAPWLMPLNDDAVFGGNAGKLVASTRQTDKYWPEDDYATAFTAVFQTRGSDGPLAASEPVLLARIAPPMNVQRIIKLGNRLLLVGRDDFYNLQTTTVWLAN